MNRTTVVFLALAILLAHTLAIHQTPAGDFATPYERAHVAYRLGRNLVHEGRAAWDTLAPAVDAYPSALWVVVAAAAERAQLYPTVVTQLVGILCALCTVVVLTQFSADRMAGLIAPVLLATCGSAAAAAASGTEAPLAMLLVTLSYLSYERGWRRLLPVVLVLLVLTRPEAFVLVAAYLALELVDRPRADEGPPRRPMQRRLLGLVFVFVAMMVIRRLSVGSWFSSFHHGLLATNLEQSRLGLFYLGGFFASSASAPLILLPALMIPARMLSGTGRRALILFAAWAGVVALAGGDSLPFWNALAPALPLGFIAIQSAITEWLDRHANHAVLAWGILLVAVTGSLLASKLPGDFGPIPMQPFIVEWMRPSEEIAEAFPHAHGRQGLLDELRRAENLRSVGLFLRDKTPPDARVATFTPGAIGYLSRKNIIDLLGRTQPPPYETRSQAWSGQPKVDLVQALEQPVDYVVPDTWSVEGGSLFEILHGWLRRYDIVGDRPERFRELTEVLRRYEVVSVPIPASSETPATSPATPCLLLRDMKLGSTPRVELQRSGRLIEVDVLHEGHRQVVDLSVVLVDQDGKAWNLCPTGAWAPESGIDARTNLLVYETGSLPIRMLSGTLPEGLVRGTVTARLRSVGIPTTSPFATAGAPGQLEIE